MMSGNPWSKTVCSWTQMDINNTFLPTMQPCSTTLSFRQACTATHSSLVPTTSYALPVHSPNRLGHEEPYFGRRPHYHARHNRPTSILYTSLQEILNSIVTFKSHSEEECRGMMSGYDEQTGWVLLTTTSKFTLYVNNAPDPPGPVDETGESIYEFALHQCLESMKDRAAGSPGQRRFLLQVDGIKPLVVWKWGFNRRGYRGRKGITRWTDEIRKMGGGLLFENMSLLLQSIKDCRKCKFAG